MIEPIVALLAVALLVIFCVRHFFVQLIAIKLLLDMLVLALSGLRTSPNSEQDIYHAAAWMVASLGAIVFFILLASGARRFSRTKNLNLEGQND
jgi:hypothetical protein